MSSAGKRKFDEMEEMTPKTTAVTPTVTPPKEAPPADEGPQDEPLNLDQMEARLNDLLDQAKQKTAVSNELPGLFSRLAETEEVISVGALTAACETSTPAISSSLSMIFTYANQVAKILHDDKSGAALKICAIKGPLALMKEDINEILSSK